jgi:hypothetical protein
MSLSSAIRAGVSSAFKAAGDIKTSVTITTITGGTYDPVTETTTGATTETQTIAECIVGSFTEFAISGSNGKILFSDIKLIVETDKLIYNVYNDSVFTINGVDYKIANPANTGRSAQGVKSAAGDFVRVYQLRA